MKILIKTCLIPLALKTHNDSFAFVHELKQEMHADLKYVESLEDEINELESNKAEFSSMYDMLLQECVLNDIMLCKEKASNVFRKEREQYFEIQDLKAQLQDKTIAIYELKKLIEKCNGKSVETKFDKPSVVRQPNAQRIPKPSVLGKPTPFFLDSLERTNFAKKKLVSKTNESKGLSKPVTPQNLPQTATQAASNTKVSKPDKYRIESSTTQTRAPQLTQTSRNTNPHVSTSIGVAYKTNVSKPQPRSNQMKDKVLPNTSQVNFKKTEVEDHPRISHISKQTKSVTVCNDSLNSRTLNVNAVCATCGKYVFNSNHDACVSKFLNDVNARTKKPHVVSVSSRKPKCQANKSVATPHKKTVASESTTTNSKSYYRMLYKKTSKAWKWVYYIEGINHNLLSVGQFYDADLEVAFRKSTCFVRDLQGNDLLTSNRGTDLYTTSLQETTSSTPICLIAKASPTQACTSRINYVPLMNPMRVASINGKKYILVIVNDYSRYTWTLFLRSKDETSEVLKDFLTMIQRNLQAPVIFVRTDEGTEFLNKTLNAFFKEEGIEHQTSIPQTLEQNGVVERRNHTLVEAA
ncbi:retrovirus-related pol polyprotein from transposon TNT 1-94 [Tanacetum coccineum]|uniref:Retrovirus-related pol polyprotein from transposon TNT 1-94 n=1 Tax=Tanacetum coccineum TaxID=301880 RepID=A0ABQ4ZPJ8_9ASTR